MRKLSIALLCLVACSSSKSTDDPGDTGDGGTNVFGGDDGGTVNPQSQQCADSTKDIFLVGEDQHIYEFHPPTLDVKDLGAISCSTGGATPTSMAVDREGYAWIRYSDTSIWKINTKDLKCQATSFVPPKEGFSQFGMGFSSTSAGSSDEALFLSDHEGAGLAKLDTKTMKTTFIGAYDGALAGQTSELTGTGDGKLYGFFVTSPTQVAEISKTDGKITPLKVLDNVFAGSAWAFSFYGGDFYVYTIAESNPQFPQAGGTSKITKYSPVTGVIEVVKQSVGFKIVGAGVSTCAPTSSPH